METIRNVLALAAQLKTKVYQLDVKSAFLNGELEEEVYAEQPQVYVEKGEDNVYRLRKALYGLKQAPRAWNNKIDHYFMQTGFTRSLSEPSLYLKKEGTHDFLILCLYVDDLIYTSTNPKLVEVFKKNMMKEYEMTDLGTMRYFLGIQGKRKKKGRVLLAAARKTNWRRRRTVHELVEFLQVREKACSLQVVGCPCWVGEGDLGAQYPPFLQPCSGSFHSWFAVFSSFLSSSLAESDEGKEVKIYAGPRGAFDRVQASIPWFFGRLWLGTCSQQLCLMSLPTCSLFFKRAEALVGYFGFF
ncbi:unnamed protein product [Prunus armeniaca]